MTLWGRKVAAIAFVVSIGATTIACGSRDASPAIPVSPQAPPPQIATPPAATPPAATPKPEPEPPPSPPKAAPQTEADASDCAVVVEPGEPIVTVALRDKVDPANAPRPSNESERVLFRQLYETLIRVDCHGRARPGLAASWRLDADGRTWMVRLRDEARFSDGVPLTTADARGAWLRDQAGEELHPRVSRLVQSIVPVDDRVLAITLRSPRADAPVALAHPDLAIAKSVIGLPWPLGTRADGSAVEPAPPGRSGSSEITIRRDRGPVIRFLQSPRDTRDVLDEGVDLLLTRDPATLDYAAKLPHYRSVPLAWGHTRVLALPGRTGASLSLSATDRQALADDAVRGEARGAAEPFWWQTLEGCTPASSHPREPSSLTPRVVYDAADAAARDLAERLVGLGRLSAQRAVGLTGEPLAMARRSGRDAGYIMSFDRQPLDPCRAIDVALDDAPWLEPASIVPLVDTRLQAIVRRARSGLTADWDGALLIAASNDSR